MSDEQQEKPKIIVDDDWKERVQAEKDAAKSEAESPDPSDADGGPAELPPASFATLVQWLTSQSLAALGQLPDAEGKRHVQLDLARHMIDTLEVLDAKTKGNLDNEESAMLTRILYELRMLFVSIDKQVSAEGDSPPASDGASGDDSNGPRIVTP